MPCCRMRFRASPILVFDLIDIVRPDLDVIAAASGGHQQIEAIDVA